MLSLDLIQHIEGKLRAAINVRMTQEDTWLLTLNLVYDGHPAGKLSFNLNGYSEEEAYEVARNLNQYPYLMREIDEYLWGESD